ncbi:MAG: hypothetical protein RJA35_1101, partial [Actinomycetota bacterium]
RAVAENWVTRLLLNMLQRYFSLCYPTLVTRL